MSEQANRRYRLAIFASHPIVYQTALFRALAERPELDVTVLFGSDWGVRSYHDRGFGKDVTWDVPLLDGYRWEILPNMSLKSDPSRFWGVINPAIMRRLRRGRFDALWVHGWSKCTEWMAMLASFVLGIPVLIRGDTSLASHLPRWKALAKWAVLTRLFRSATGLLTIGRYNAAFYRDYGVPPEKLFHVPYTVDNHYFVQRSAELKPKKDALRRELALPEGMPLFLFVGKLVDCKSPFNLLQAFAGVRRTLEAALVFVGDGPLRQDLQAYSLSQQLPNVYFAGFQNQTALPSFYATSDVFVLPSSREPWGLVVNEAMCFGLPIVVSNRVGAAGDLVRDGANGLIYPAGDVDALSERLALLLRDPARRDEMGRASLAIIRQWSMREATQAVVECLAKIMDRRGPRSRYAPAASL